MSDTDHKTDKKTFSHVNDKKAYDNFCGNINKIHKQNVTWLIKDVFSIQLCENTHFSEKLTCDLILKKLHK